MKIQIDYCMTDEQLKPYMTLKAETEQIDFKQEFKFKTTRDKLELIKDIISFANTKGGFIIYGVEKKCYEWVGLTSESDDLPDETQIRSELKKYIKEFMEINFSLTQHFFDNRTFYVLGVQQYNSSTAELISFTENGNYVVSIKTGKSEERRVFDRYCTYGRIGTSCQPITNNLAQFKKYRNNNKNIISNLNNFPAPYSRYVNRDKLLKELIDKLNVEKNCFIMVQGLGGIGKTSFIRNFCEQLESDSVETLKGKYQYIVWITGKMTLFEPSGKISNINYKELTMAELIEIFKEIFLIQENNTELIKQKVLQMLNDYCCLIILDNMETINDKEINIFLQKIPFKSNVIVTSRTSIENIYAPTIYLNGFEYDEFLTYFKQQLGFFGEKSTNIEEYFKNAEKLRILHKASYGSPIIINMISYQLAKGSDIEYLIEGLDENKKENCQLYDQVMEFCFNETFAQLKTVEKEILYILSISQNSEKRISRLELEKIVTVKNKEEIHSAIQNLVKLSFLIKDNDEYFSPSLVKIFSNKKLSADSKVDTEKLGINYTNLNRNYNRIENNNNFYFDQVKAYTQQEKTLALKLREIINDNSISNNNLETLKKLNNLIKENPNFARLYFEKANILIQMESSIADIRNSFDMTVEKDPKNDLYWLMYGRFEFNVSKKKSNGSESKQFREYAKKYFTNSVSLNDSNYHAHHSLALVLSNEYSSNKTSELLNTIKTEFKKGFSADNIYHNTVNCHAYATFLYNNDYFSDALLICQEGIKSYNKIDNVNTLKALEGTIIKKLDPDFVGKTKITSMRSGIFQNASESTLKKIYDTYINKK